MAKFFFRRDLICSNQHRAFKKRIPFQPPFGAAVFAYDAFDNLTAITRGDSMQYALGY